MPRPPPSVDGALGGTGFTARSVAPAPVPCAGLAAGCPWLPGVTPMVGSGWGEIAGTESDGMCTAGTTPAAGEGRGTGRGSDRKAAATPPLNFRNDQPVAVISIHPPRSNRAAPPLSNVPAVPFLYLHPTNLPYAF